MSTWKAPGNRNPNGNLSFSPFSPALTPQFTPHTREEYERYMSEQQRNHERSPHSYSSHDLPRFQQPHYFPTSDVLGSNSPSAESEESVVPILADVNDLLNAPGRTHLPVLCPNREGTDIWFRRDRTGKITKQLLKMLKSDLPKPYPTYRSLP